MSRHQRRKAKYVARRTDVVAESVVLFAGGSPALREAIPLAVAVPDTFVVADTPRLRPLVAALAETPRALVVFVDGERARLILLRDDGSTDDIVLDHSDIVVGHHRRGGWALCAVEVRQAHACAP